MAMMDNKAFLISHIRNSFITSDDTGMCELILDSHDPRDRPNSSSSAERVRPVTWHSAARGSVEDINGSLSDVQIDTELSHSYDILPDMDFSSHRRRSSTAQRLEKLKRERTQRNQVRHIQWRQAATTDVSEVAELFEKKPVAPEVSGTGNTSRKSALTLALEQMPELEHNPFQDYAKFDGKAAGGHVKTIEIFLTMAPAAERPYPMSVVAVGTTRVEELIGQICWQYTQQARQPPLHHSVDCYALHIAEDDGEVDLDFPALDTREPISKFGFGKLALVEREVPRRHMSSTVVTIYMPNRGFTRIPIDDDSILMRDLLEKVLARRKVRQIKGLEYRLEKQNEPGVVVDLDRQLRQMSTLEFCCVRENSSRGDQESEALGEGDITDMAASLSSHQYRVYHVTLVQKFTSNVPVQLGISGDKVEIDPKQSKSLVFKNKAMTYAIENIACCEPIHRDKASGKQALRIVYCHGHDFRHFDFECEAGVAREIETKLNYILEFRSSPKRKEYRQHKVKKNYFKRHSISFS